MGSEASAVTTSTVEVKDFFVRNGIKNGKEGSFIISDLSEESVESAADRVAEKVVEKLKANNEAVYTKTHLGIAAGGGFVVGAISTGLVARYGGWFNRPIQVTAEVTPTMGTKPK